MLSPQFPDLAALELLLIVARTGSLNMAATEIGITQQAASARITSIEAQTGVVLMSRTARGSTLTAAGTVVAEWAARLLDVAAEVDAGLASLRSDRVSTLRVSASLTIAEQLLPGWLVALNADQARRAQAPVQIVLRATNSDTVVVDVRDGVADVGFVEGPVRAPRAAQPPSGRGPIGRCRPARPPVGAPTDAGDTRRDRRHRAGDPRSRIGHPERLRGRIARGPQRRPGAGCARPGPVDQRRRPGCGHRRSRTGCPQRARGR